MALLAPEPPNGSGGEGNTSSSPPDKKKRPSGAYNWLFTWNNYPENWMALLAPALEQNEWIIGEEIGKKGTPHLQGYIEFKSKVRPIGYKKTPIEIHWGDENGKPARGGRLANVKYCSKDGKFQGTLKPPRELVKMTYDKLRDWQKEIADNFLKPEDPLFGRKIYWYWEKNGNVGKSVLCKYFVDCCNAIILSGSAADMKYGVSSFVSEHNEGPEIVVMDIPRVQDHISIKGIEEIKNGCFFSSKYESGMCRYNCPHVIIFANVPPEIESMSSDRWIIKNIDENL